MICAPLNQCSYKKLCGNFSSYLSSACESTANSPKTAIRKEKRSNHSVRALAVARISRRSAVPSQRSLLIVSRCPRPPLRAIFRITDIFYGPHPLAGGRSDALLHPCLLSSLDWDPLPERRGNLQTLEIDAKDPLSVAPKGQSRLQISLEKRDDHSTADDSGPQQPLSDAPAELPILHHRGQPCYSVARIRA